MMDDWLAGAQSASSVLVTVGLVEGSGPREAGARMLVSLDDMIKALPHDWDGEVAVWHKGVLAIRFRFPPRAA